MKSYKIAILDSGCNCSQREKYNITMFKNFISNDALCLDDNGHGTAIFEILARIQPNAEFIIIKVLDKNAVSKISVINDALEYLLQLSIDYICMSFSTCLDCKNEKMYFLCQQLRRQGKILVASKANSGKKSYPAEFDNVIGVEGIVLDNSDELWYMPERSIQIVADVLPVMVPSKDGKQYVMFGGNSKATAYVCGIIAKHSQNLKVFLQQNRSDRIWTDEELLAKKKYIVAANEYKEYSDQLFGQICYVLDQHTKGLSKKRNLHDFLTPSDYYNILEQIEKESSYLIDYCNVRYKDFDTVGTLFKRIQNIGKRISIINSKSI
ncbi:MAG: S8 family serine peptidase [Lachnospiraceae bacterium]